MRILFSKDHTGRKVLAPFLMALFCIVVWGVSYAVTRSAVQQIGPLMLACLRFYLAAFLMWFFIRKTPVRLQAGDRRNIAALTLSGITLYFAFENVGLKLTTASHGALIIATIPLGTELVWAWRRRKRPPLGTVIGTMAAISGVALLVGPGSGDFSTIGDLLMFGAVGCWIYYTFQVEKIAGRYPPLLTTFWMMLAGAISFTPGAIVELWLYPWQRQPDLWAWAQVLFLGVVCSAMGYDLWNRAVPALGSIVINTLLYFIPLVGVVSGVLFLNEPVTPALFWGGGLIFCGVFLAGRG